MAKSDAIWKWVLFALVITGVMTWLVLQPASTKKAASGDPRPRIFLDRDTHDFGTVMSGEKVTHRFKIRNVGDATLVLRKISASCSCTVPKVELTLNRYKEKCFLVKPLMRKLHAAGKLTGPPADLMKPFPREMLYDTRLDPHEIKNLATSKNPIHQSALKRLRAALDTWQTATNDRGHIPEPKEVVAPFTKEMHNWFGTPDWVKD